MIRYPTEAYDSWLTKGIEPDIDTEWQCDTCKRFVSEDRDFCPHCNGEEGKDTYVLGPEDFIDTDPDVYVPEWFDGTRFCES